VIPVQFGGLPVGVGQTLLMFTMKRGIVATFDPEYSDKRMPRLHIDGYVRRG